MGKQKTNSGGTNTARPEKRLCTESNNSTGAPRLPWEAKKMKIDLIAAKAKHCRHACHASSTTFNCLQESIHRIISNPPKDMPASPNLCSSDGNQSIKEGLSNLLSMDKENTSTGGTDRATPEKQPHTDSNISAGAPPLPWEAKRMKIDLIAAKAQISKLEAGVNHQHTIPNEMQILFEEEKQSLMDDKRDERKLAEMEDRLQLIQGSEKELKEGLAEISKLEAGVNHQHTIPNEMQILFEEEKQSLMNQHKRDERKLAEMEDQLQLIQRSEKELKENLAEAAKEYRESKTRWDAERSKLHKQIADLLEEQVSTENQTSEMKKDMEELLQACRESDKVYYIKTKSAKQTSQAEQLETAGHITTQLEKQTFELQQVNNKLRELEYLRDSYKDWQQQAKTAQNRLCDTEELEKEVVRRLALERNLRDTVYNNLLLQEKVHLLSSRVEELQPVQQELMEAKVKIASLESSLSEWISVAQAHCVDYPRALSAALESAFNGQLTAADHSSQARSQTALLTEVKIESPLSEWLSAAQEHGVESPRALSAALESAFNGQLTAADHSSQAHSQTAQLTEVKIESPLSEWLSAAQEHGVESPRALSAALESAFNGQLTAADHSSQAHSQTAQLTEVKIESPLSEWLSAAQEHGVESPRALSAALESAFNGQLTAADHSSQAHSQTAQLTEIQGREGLQTSQSSPEEVQQLEQQLVISSVKIERMEEEFTDFTDKA